MDQPVRAGTVCIVGILLMACSQSQPTASRTPAATSTAQVSSTPIASPPVAGDLPVTKVDFACRLPVLTVAPGVGSPPLQGGFISFPGGEYAADPNGTMSARGLPHDDYATNISPVLYGDGGGFYDRAAKRWVPAAPAATLPDGSAYAYVTVDSTAQIVDVASGNVRSFPLRGLDRPAVLDFDARGVYLFSPSAIGGPGEGVWLLNPTSGAVTQVAVVHRVWAVRDGKAWAARLDPRDQTVWPAMEIAPADSLVEVDLGTGTETEWFYRAGAYPWMLGFASGRPLVGVADSAGRTEVRLVDQPGSDGKLIYSGNLAFDGSFLEYQGDGDRIWLGSPRGLYLYRPDRGLQKVFAYNAAPGSGGDMRPAGVCL